MRMDLRTLDLICLTGLVSLTLLCGIAIVKAVKGRVVLIESHNRAVEEHIVNLKKAETCLDTLDCALQLNQSALDVLRSHLPEAQDMGSFLAALDVMATRNQVVVISVMPGTLVRESLYTRTPVEIACRGSFASLHILLHELEHLDRLVRIRRLSLGRAGLSADCELNASCDVYGR